MPGDALTSEFEQAIRELRELCNADVPLEERKLRLSVRKELNRLHRLYETMRELEAAADSTESEVLATIRCHLEPLGLAAEGTPVEELARLAALKITEK